MNLADILMIIIVLFIIVNHTVTLLSNPYNTFILTFTPICEIRIGFMHKGLSIQTLIKLINISAQSVPDKRGILVDIGILIYFV